MADIPLPPGAKLVDAPTTMKLPPGATLVSGGGDKPGALSRFGTGLYETTIGPMVDAVKDIPGAVAGAFNLPKLQEIAQHVKEGNYGHAALAIGQYATENPANRAATGMVNDVAHDVKEGNLAGATGRVIGDAIMLAGPKAAEGVAGPAADVARVATDPAVIRAGVKVLPKGPAAVALWDTLQTVRSEIAAKRAKIQGQPPLNRSPIWESNPEPVPQGPPEFTSAQPPMGMDIEGNMRPAALPSGRRVGPAPAAPTPAPTSTAQRVSLADQYGLSPNPNVVPEFSSIPGTLPSGRVPGGRPPGNTVQQTIAQIQEIAQRPAESPQSKQPIPIDLARQLFDEMKQSGTAPVEEAAAVAEAPKDFEAAPRAQKANKLAQALHDGGIPFEDAKLMDRSHWDMLSKGLGVNAPSEASISETLVYLKRLEAKMPKSKSAKQ